MKEIAVFTAILIAILLLGIAISFENLAEQELINRSTTLMINISEPLNVKQDYQDLITTAGQRSLGIPYDLIFLMIVFVVIGFSLWDAYKRTPTNPVFFATRTFGGLVLGIFFLSIFLIYIFQWIYTEILNQIFTFTLTNYPIMNHFHSLWWVYFIIFYAANIITNQFLGNDGVGEQ